MSDCGKWAFQLEHHNSDMYTKSLVINCGFKPSAHRVSQSITKISPIIFSSIVISEEFSFTSLLLWTELIWACYTRYPQLCSKAVPS